MRQALALLLWTAFAARGGYVDGHVVSRGKPLAKARVTIRPGEIDAGASRMRTGSTGRFIFTLRPGLAYRLTVEAAGHASRDIDIKPQRHGKPINLGAIALEPGPGFLPSPDLPAEVLERIWKDFGFELPFQDCVDGEDTTLQDILRLTWTQIGETAEDGLVIEGLGPSCLAGANNGPLLVYTLSGNEWRLALRGNGSWIEVLPSSSSGLHDLALWRHDSAFVSERSTLRYQGDRYRETACHLVESANPRTGTPHPVPKEKPCR